MSIYINVPRSIFLKGMSEYAFIIHAKVKKVQIKLLSFSSTLHPLPCVEPVIVLPTVLNKQKSVIFNVYCRKLKQCKNIFTNEICLAATIGYLLIFSHTRIVLYYESSNFNRNHFCIIKNVCVCV